VYALILSKLLIVLMGFPRLGKAFYTETAHYCTFSLLYDVRHAWYVVDQCRPLDCGGLKCWLQLTCHRVMWGSITSHNTKQTAISKLKTIKQILPMYGQPSCSLSALDLSSGNSVWKWKKIDDQPHRKWVELYPKPNFNPYRKQQQILWLVRLLMSICPKLNLVIRW